MKTLISAALIGLVSITASIADEAEKPVESFYQRVDIQRQPQFSVQGMNVRQQIRYQLLSSFDVFAEDEKGHRKATQTVTDAILVEADPLSHTVFAASLAEMKGQKFTYTINKFSEVVSMEGHQDKTKTVDVKKPKSKGVLVSTVIDEDGWKELAQLTLFQPPPDRSRARAFVRKTTHDWDSLGSWYGKTDFRLRGSKGDQKLYVYQHRLEYIPPNKNAPRDRELPFEIQNAMFHAYDASGQIQFNEKQRRVEMVRESFHARGAVETTMLGVPSTVSVEEKQLFTITVTGRKSLKLP